MNPSDILKRLDPERIRVKLEDFPSRISTQKAHIRLCRNSFKDAEQDRQAVIAEMMAEIANVKDPSTGKAQFSNNEARQAELSKRQRINEDYKIAAKVARELEFELNKAEDELEKIQNEYKSSCYISQLITAELEFWANTNKPIAIGQAQSPEPY